MRIIAVYTKWMMIMIECFFFSFLTFRPTQTLLLAMKRSRGEEI